MHRSVYISNAYIHMCKGICILKSYIVYSRFWYMHLHTLTFTYDLHLRGCMLQSYISHVHLQDPTGEKGRFLEDNSKRHGASGCRVWFQCAVINPQHTMSKANSFGEPHVEKKLTSGVVISLRIKRWLDNVLNPLNPIVSVNGSVASQTNVQKESTARPIMAVSFLMSRIQKETKGLNWAAGYPSWSAAVHNGQSATENVEALG